MFLFAQLGTTHVLGSSSCLLVPMGWVAARGAVVLFVDTIDVCTTIIVVWHSLTNIRKRGLAIGVAIETTKGGDLMIDIYNGGLVFLKFGVGDG